MVKWIRDAIYSEFPFFCSLPAVVWQLVFMVAPVSIILYFSFFTEVGIPTLSNYITLIDAPHFKIIFRSFFIAVTTASVCLFLAYPVAYYLSMHVKRGKKMLLFLLTLPFWVNFLVQIYAWFYLLDRNGLINSVLLKIGVIQEPLILANSLFAIYLVMIYCYLPFMIMPLYSTLEKIDLRLLDASADLGATPWQTFWNVTIPLSLSGIRTGFLLVLVPSFGEFVIPALLGGSKQLLVGSLISYYFLVARDQSLGAAFTCMSGLVLAGMIGGLLFLRRLYLRVRSGL